VGSYVEFGVYGAHILTPLLRDTLQELVFLCLSRASEVSTCAMTRMRSAMKTSVSADLAIVQQPAPAVTITIAIYYYYFGPARDAKYWDKYVCLCVYSHNSETTRPNCNN